MNLALAQSIHLKSQNCFIANNFVGRSSGVHRSSGCGLGLSQENLVPRVMLCSFMFLPLQKVRFEQQVQEDEALLGVWRFRFYVHIKLLPNRLVVKNSAQAPFGLLIYFGVCCSGNVNWTVAQCNGGYLAVKRWAVFFMTHIFTESSEQVPRRVLASGAKLALLEASGRQLIQWDFFYEGNMGA